MKDATYSIREQFSPWIAVRRRKLFALVTSHFRRRKENDLRTTACMSTTTKCSRSNGGRGVD
ncbi:hypothetical protein DPMN_163371 [Dreissena polymorpha]|uniref:Uncharacterized protein n=1 Tax=Dreissena polymorpha TaxID=45954 RepID=A0A9D4ERR2_DREPO|nr:hypothetical protein DPMN_163285 [Dreissena polymorpha]KAH3785286.1 hypothetical protein DPMN_163371 [Dreissena polymorpha]